MRLRRATVDPLASMPPHLATFDIDLWCAGGATVAEAQPRWEAEVAEWADENGVDGIVLIERLAFTGGTFSYPTLNRRQRIP